MSENDVMAGNGGYRPGAGRKSNIEKALAGIIDCPAGYITTGILPLELMLTAMRRAWDRVLLLEEIPITEEFTKNKKDKALYLLENDAFTKASACAPYIHPRLNSIKTDGPSDGTEKPPMIEAYVKQDATI